jgi:hypothetical protein
MKYLEVIKMAMPTHIVAAGGIVENEQGEILLVKDTAWRLGLSWWTSGSWGESNGCIN